MSHRSLLIVALLVAVCASPLVVSADVKPTKETKIAAAEWTQWRGPHRDAISPDTGLLDKWPAEGPKLLWQTKGLGKGYSSISLAGGKIFTMGDRGKDQFVICLDARDGAELWATRIGKNWGDGGPRCTPTIDGDRLYAIGPHGDLACLKVADGAVVWAKDFGADFGGKMMSGWGYCESPLIDGDWLVCSPGNDSEAAMAALDKATGEVIWKAGLGEMGSKGKDGAGYSSIVISNACGVKQYVQLVGRGVFGVRAEDGKFLWGYNRVANGTANIPTPIVKGDFVFCSTGYGTGSALLKLVKDGDGVKAEEQYFLNADKLQNHHGGLILIGDYIYGGQGHNNGNPICVEMKTGKIVWGGKLSDEQVAGKRSAAVVFADGNLYFRYESGDMALVGATPKGYELKGKFKIPEVNAPSWPHPVVIGGKLYLREQDRLFVYQVAAS